MFHSAQQTYSPGIADLDAISSEDPKNIYNLNEKLKRNETFYEIIGVRFLHRSHQFIHVFSS